MDVFITQNCPTIVDDLERAIKSGVTTQDLIMDTGYQIFGACSQDYIDNYWKKHESEFRAALSFIWEWYANEDEFHFSNNCERMIFVYQVLASDMEDDIIAKISEK